MSHPGVLNNGNKNDVQKRRHEGKQEIAFGLHYCERVVAGELPKYGYSRIFFLDTLRVCLGCCRLWR